jgi:hypothetical protein
MEFLSKLGGLHNQRSLRLCGADHFMIGRHDRALRSILLRKPLDNLVRPLAPLRIDDLDSGAVLAALNRLSSLPTVEDDRQRMPFPVTIRG